MENMGIKVVSGDISLILSQGTYEATNDEDREQPRWMLFPTKCLMV